MKRTIYLIFISIAISIASCEKIDNLAEMGTLTEVEFANSNLSAIAATAVGDTITLTNSCWAVNDNIAKVEYAHKGFKLATLAVKWKISANSVNYEYSYSFNTDSIKVEETPIATVTELNPFYQTLYNAYVVKQPFVIPTDYAVVKVEGEEVVTDMDAVYFQKFVDYFATKLNKDVTTALFPATATDDGTLFVKVDEAFTGALTDAGKQYIKDNLTKAIINSHFDAASSIGFGKVTIVSNTVLTTGSVAKRVRTFEILIK